MYWGEIDFFLQILYRKNHNYIIKCSADKSFTRTFQHALMLKKRLRVWNSKGAKTSTKYAKACAATSCTKHNFHRYLILKQKKQSASNLSKVYIYIYIYIYIQGIYLCVYETLVSYSLQRDSTREYLEAIYL